MDTCYTGRLGHVLVVVRLGNTSLARAFATSRSKPELLLLDPWDNSSKRKDRSNNDRPELDIEDVYVERRLRCSANCGQSQGKDSVASHPMVLPHLLRLVHTTV